MRMTLIVAGALTMAGAGMALAAGAPQARTPTMHGFTAGEATYTAMKRSRRSAATGRTGIQGRAMGGTGANATTGSYAAPTGK